MNYARKAFSWREVIARHKTALLLLLALQLVRGIIYGAVVPPWQGPDETWHYEYVRAVAQGETAQKSTPALSAEMEESLNTFRFWASHWVGLPSSRSSYTALWQTSLLSGRDRYSPLHPMLLAPIYKLTANLDIASRLLALRLVSVFTGAGVILLLFLAAAMLFPEEEELIVGIPAFALFLPMHTFMGSVVNSDNLTELWASAAIFLMLTWFRNGLSPWRVSGALLATILGVLTKRIALFLIPLSLFALALCVGRSLPWKKWGAIWLPALVLFVGLAGLGLFVLYAGPGLWGGLLASFSSRVVDSRRLSEMVQRAGSFWGLAQAFHQTFVTFWAAFGWGNVYLDWGCYRPLLAVSLVIAASSARYLFDLRKKAASMERWRLEAIAFLLAALLLSLLVGLGAMIFAGGRYMLGLHVRYFFPVVIPVATFFLLGWRGLFPQRYRRYALPILLAALILFDVVAMGYYIVPFYYS